MAKAKLYCIDIEETPRDSFDIVNSSGELVSTISGPQTYRYILKYISNKPMCLDDFPKEINFNINQINTEKTESKEIKIKTIYNPIQELDIF